MDKPDGSAAAQQPTTANGAGETPPGDHPLEVAARRGIGPLSPLGRGVWHGQARPCVSCGHLVLRNQRECDHCGQDLSDQMIKKMRAHAGPWDVFEHLHPFPGVSLERIIRQIRRGLLTETSIVRGPATDFQWRFAIETPGLCRYFGRCWNCHGKVSPSDTYCAGCLAHLSFEKPRPVTVQAADSEQPLPKELQELTAALDETQVQRHEAIHDEPPRIAGIRATWIAVAILVLVVAFLLWATRARTHSTGPPRPPVPGWIAAPVQSQGSLLNNPCCRDSRQAPRNRSHQSVG